MHGSKIAIWFFIGVVLVVYGGLIFGYGLYEWAAGSYPSGVELTELHTPVWWGGVLEILGIIYVVKFRPGRESK